MASLYRLPSRATTKLQKFIKIQYICNKHNTYLQKNVYKGVFKTSNFPVEKLVWNCLSVNSHERDRYAGANQKLSLLGLLTTGVFTLAFINDTVKAGKNDETPEAKNSSGFFRENGKFATTKSMQTRSEKSQKMNEKLQKMNAGLAKRKLCFENSDGGTKEEEICTKKRMTRSMEVNIYTENH